MAGRELRLLKLQGFLAKRDGFGVPAEIAVRVGESDHAAERLEVVATQNALLDGDRLFEQRGCLAKSSDVPEILCQVGHSLKCVEVIRTECGLHELSRPHVELEGIIKAVENSVASGQGELASERVDVFGAERGSASHERLLTKLESLRLVAEGGARVAKMCMLSSVSR